jgi:hypothetical protein
VTDRGADVVNRTEGNTECVVVAGRIRSAGAEEQSMFAKGLPRNLGDPACLHERGRRKRIEAPAQSRKGAGKRHLPASHEPQQCVISPDERAVSRGKGTTGSRNALMVPRKPEK